MATPTEQPQASKRDAMLGRLRGKYADKKFEDDEEIFGQIGEDYDSYDNQLEEYKKREGTFSDLFTKDPRSAAFMQNWKNGGDPVIALIDEFGTDIKDAIDDPERMDEIAQANKNFAERVAKEKELNEQYKANIADSIKTLDESGLSEDEANKVMEFLITIVTDGVMGKFTKESIELAKKALNYDSAVQSAGDEGEIRGRNQKIDEKLRKAKKGDGTMPLTGGSTAPKREPMPNFGAIDSMGGDDIWARGGEKRRKY